MWIAQWTTEKGKVYKMWLFIFIIVLIVYLPYVFSRKINGNKYYKITIIATNLGIVIFTLFSFKIYRDIPFFGPIISFVFCIAFIIINILFVLTKTIKSREIKNIFLMLFVLLSGLFFYQDIKHNISERIILKMEFPKFQKIVTNYINNNVKNENIRTYNNYIGIIWDPGLLDYYSVIIYDENNNLDVLVKTSEETIKNTEQYKEYTEAFKYEKITNIIKIQDNYYRCKMWD